jgi:molecular chaperone GrpE
MVDDTESNEPKEAQNGANGGGEAQAATVEDTIAKLEQEKQKLEQDKKDLHDRLLRTAADFENWKKRAKKEVDEGATKGREGLIKELLPVIDNLERAIKHAPGDDPLAQGVRMVEKQLLSALEKFGITRFSAEGQPFDPAMHDAIQQVETADVPSGSVATQFAAGYLQNGKLLRPAMVGVAKAPEGTQPKENG